MSHILVLESEGSAKGLSREELEGLASSDAQAASSRYGDGAGVWVRDILDRSDVPEHATHLTFHATDGYAASVPIEQAVRDAVILVPAAGTGRIGVRIVVREGETACMNVKAVERIELSAGPGKHTVDPNPHKNPPVPGWDR